MAMLDGVLLGVTLAVLALNGLAVLLVVPRIRRATERSQAAVGRMGSVLERSLGGLRTVKASGAEDEEIASVDRAARRAWRRGVEVARWTALMEASAGLAVQVSFLAVLGVGGIRVASGALPVSSLIAFLLYLFLLSDPISTLVNGTTQLQAGARRRGPDAGAAGAAHRAGGRDASTGGAASSQRPAAIAFTGVWFRYRSTEDSPWVHRDLTFELPPGGMTAIVGPSGTGKSHHLRAAGALLRAPERHHRRGRPGHRDWPLPELRAAIGYVEQDAPSWPARWRENLSLAAPDATDDGSPGRGHPHRPGRPARAAPVGLDTPVGHRGTTLSGGQRQRIAIARALLRRPRILLLDEATSQLDAVNEVALRDLMEAVALTTTVLVVAHRLSTVTSADRILVMEEGRVRAAGTHDELLGTDDLYRAARDHPAPRHRGMSALLALIVRM